MADCLGGDCPQAMMQEERRKDSARKIDTVYEHVIKQSVTLERIEGDIRHVKENQRRVEETLDKHDTRIRRVEERGATKLDWPGIGTLAGICIAAIAIFKYLLN